MAETGKEKEKGFGKKLGKIQSSFTRTKERALQLLGTADKTTDNEFNQLVDGFSEQQHTANQLLKEFKSYAAQVKAMSAASHSVYQAISESYDPSWRNSDTVSPSTELLIKSWDNYIETLQEEVLAPLNNYAKKFKDVKIKIEKRARKLTDFDSTRHTVESLENAKKRDEVKIGKAHDEMNAAKSIYEGIHSELLTELPALYQSRVPTLCGFFRTLMNSEATFQTESARIKTDLARLIESQGDMRTETPIKSQKSVCPARPPVVQRDVAKHEMKSPSEDVHGTNSQHKPKLHTNDAEEEDSTEGNENADAETSLYLELVGDGKGRIASDSSDVEESGRADEKRESPDRSTDGESGAKRSSYSKSGSDIDISADAKLHSSTPSVDSEPKEHAHVKKENNEAEDLKKSHRSSANDKDEKRSSDVIQRKASSSDEDDVTPTEKKAASNSNFLYEVVAIHGYAAEDGDELSFEKGDVLGVLPFEDTSDEPDDGWLLGIRCLTGDKGMFPVNFTSRM